jgi:hypothetical protein
MSRLRQFVLRNPRPEWPLGSTAAAIAQRLEARYAGLAGEFLGLFCDQSPDEAAAVVGVGSELQIEAVKDGRALRVCLKHRGAVDIAFSYQLGDGDLHAEVFARTARFMESIRERLAQHYRLPPSAPFLGGWRCGTEPGSLDEPLIFTLPRIVCRLSGRDCVVSVFGEGADLGIADDIGSGALDVAPVGDIKVLRRKEIPECREYVNALTDLIGELSQAAMDKVVICREVRLSLEQAISPLQLLRMASVKKSSRYEYVFRWSGGDAWVGVSPELLVKKRDNLVAAEPLAGTRKGSDSKEKSVRYRSELLADSKEIEEHETAAGMFLDGLGAVCEPGSIRQLESRGVIDLGYVQHLKSTLTGHIRPGLNVFDLLAAIYPPATIWGKPLALSGERIRSYERIDRGFYTGGLGVFTLGDDANFALAIRTARIAGNEVRVYAGSGIVKKSDPYREWLETSNKMQPFLNREFMSGL